MRYLVGIAAGAFLASLVTGLTQVQPGEIAVVRRFGRVLDEKPGPGLYIGLPWGLERVDRVDVDTVRQVGAGYAGTDAPESDVTPPGQLLTGRHNLINVSVVINYKVRPEEVVDFVVQQDRVKPLLERAAETALAEWVAGREIDLVLLRGKHELPGWLVSRVQSRVEPYRLGVQVTHAAVPHLAAPAEVKSAFDAVSRVTNEAAQRQNAANQKKNRLWQEALTEKNRIAREVEGYAHEKRVLAEAEAATFMKRLAQYRKLGKGNPQYLNALWWNEMTRLYARLRANGRIDVLDNYLGASGLDITQMPLLPRGRK